MNNISWKSLVEQLRMKIYYILQFLSLEKYEEFVVDNMEFLQPDIFQYNNHLLYKSRDMMYLVDILDLMKEYGIDDNYFKFIKDIPDQNIPNHIKEQIYNFIQQEEIDESELENIIDILKDIYQYY